MKYKEWHATCLDKVNRVLPILVANYFNLHFKDNQEFQFRERHHMVKNKNDLTYNININQAKHKIATCITLNFMAALLGTNRS